MAQLKDLIVTGPSRFVGPTYGLIQAFSANGATISMMIGGETASATVSISDSSPSISIGTNGSGVVTGGTTGGTKGHAITLNKTTAIKINSASTCDTAVSANKTAGILRIYNNGTLLTSFDGSSTISALTVDTNTSTTYAGHYTPSTANASASTTGARITGITRDGKGHILSIATAATDNTDAKVADAAGTGKAFLLGHTTQATTATSISNANVYMSGGAVYSEGKKVLTGFTQASVTIGTSGSGVVTGGTSGGTAGHSITLNKTTAVKINSASTCDTAVSANKTAGTLAIYKNGTLLASFNGSGNASALTTDNNTNVAMSTGAAATSASITINTTAARTYHIYSGTTASITLAGTIQNPGWDHYALFRNTGSGSMVITPKAGWITTDATFTVPAGGYLELSWVCCGGYLILTGSKAMVVK